MQLIHLVLQLHCNIAVLHNRDGSTELLLSDVPYSISGHLCQELDTVSSPDF